TITDSIISNNLSSQGDMGSVGAGVASYGPLTITDSTISGNYSIFSGGGIYCGLATTITRCIITGNTCEIFGGGISDYGPTGIQNYGPLTITDSTISDNHAGDTEGFGGGLSHVGSGTCTILNSTFNNNRATPATSGAGVGGAVYNGGPLVITNS